MTHQQSAPRRPRTSTRPRASCFLFGAVLAACAGAPPASAPKPADPSRKHAEVTVPRTVITPARATDIPELFDSAMQHATRGDYEKAAAEFDRVVALDPNGDLADDALFNAAEAHDHAGAMEAAVARYEQLPRRYPQSQWATKSLVRATNVLVFLERWDRADELAGRALASEARLGPFERVVTYAARALARLAHDDDQGASVFIEKGRAVVDAHQLDAAGRIAPELAALYFALGELRRIRADRIVFNPMPPNFADALERRCQLLLDAQSAYSDTMRAYNAHWSMMAGYRVGELYHQLHKDVMRLDPPATADTQAKRDLFEGAMRLRYSILLTKALGMIEHTLSMGERTGERSSWSARLLDARTAIKAAIAEEKAALDRLPYSRATIEAALTDLTRRVESRSASPPTRAKPIQNP